jgi:hypothetical protein
VTLTNIGLRHLRAFVVLAEELHFARAAARLHVSQPALSQTIRQLERDPGLRLLTRTTRRVELTAEGADVRDAAVEVLAPFDQPRWRSATRRRSPMAGRTADRYVELKHDSDRAADPTSHLRMTPLAGVDIGTSGTKVVVVDRIGCVVGYGERSHRTSDPQAGCSETAALSPFGHSRPDARSSANGAAPVVEGGPSD